MSAYPSGINPAEYSEPFASLYRTHLQHLQLKGLRPKTIDAYARAMRRIGTHFNFEVSALSMAPLTDCFTAMKAQHSWSGAKSGKPATRTLPGAGFLWLLLQHVLPKGFQRARTFGFLHHNSRRALRLLELLHVRPSPAQTTVVVPAQRPIWRCVCGGAMVIVRRRMRPGAVPGCTTPQTILPD